MLGFRYKPEIFNKYPALRAGVVYGREIHNGPTPEALKQVFITEQQAILRSIGATPLSQIESLAAWRAAFRDFGVDPTKYRSAPEALLRRLIKKGDIPCINILVDICNLVSIRYGLPIAAFDLDEQDGFLTVGFASGNEWFTPLGGGQAEHPESGEVIFTEPQGRVAARRWCWRQSEQSAARWTTRQVIITVEAQHDAGDVDSRSAVEDLLVLLQEFGGGQLQTGVLGPTQHACAFE